MSSPKRRKGFTAFENLISELTKGAGCFERIPNRRFGIMRTSVQSHWWEIHDIHIGRRLTSFKTWEANSGVLDTYAFHIACLVDVLRIAKSVYKDEGIGSNVVKTGGSIAFGWVGAYLGAQGGYRAGEFVGSLMGSTQTGICAVIGGYLGGVFGAHCGDRIVQTLLQPEDD